MSKDRLRAGALALFALWLGLSCAQSDTGNMTDGTGAADMDMGPPEEEGCFMGTPQSERELLNRCTDAERVDRPHRVPERVWDGRGPLPPAP